MNFKNITIRELHDKLVNKEISPKELIKSTIENAKKHLGSNFLITLCEKEAIENVEKFSSKIDEKNFLWSIPYVSKDNIATKGILTTSGSKILSNYYPPFDATITEILNEKNSVMIGKTALDELGMGGTGLFSFNGEVRNPYDNERLIGGSSSGSTYAVCEGIVPFSIGTDTGDSIRKPASFAGIVGFKPTYGSISRYGVAPYAPSLDHVGFFTNNIEDMAVICDSTFKYDLKDFTSIDNSIKFLDNLNNKKKVKFGFIKHVEKFMEGKVKRSYEKFFNYLKKDGHKVIKVDFDKKLLDAIPAIYMMISFAEGVSTNANLDGIKFGLRQPGEDYKQIITNSRTKGFGDTVKRRFIIGSYQLKSENQELLLAKSKKVRRLIVNELNKIYEQIDILIFPPSLKPAPLVKNVLGTDVEEREDNDAAFLDDLLILSNLNGMPSITLPFIKENELPIGINLNAKPKEDLFLLQISKYVEDLINKLNKGGEFDE
ncbi:amidase family protein [Spiroplasma taiwanense]|uniref:Aspartyl/glutamyl-tRNA amidotransferase subunit A n=1 Tax=Spiroplasma taiwanense CT-1 TaxID=1276220 RepID=S5MG49_9MOLU|nr:amidase family protein [Spiroplasma taiwanense]AGR40835.1 aspartyl/glutamyl-tRNA amidotransferase subunit A [Spiroplasma taiwanense CT-1]